MTTRSSQRMSGTARVAVAAIQLRQQKRAAVSLLFATMVVPMMMLIGLSIDYSNYAHILSELDLAADAGAIHAVRTAETVYVATPASQASSAASNAITAGNNAAAQWYAAELSNFTGNANIIVSSANVAFTNSTFTETVSFSGTYRTIFSKLFHVSSWPIRGTSKAAVTVSSYVEIAMLIDNSSSMQIGATPADIETIEGWTLCAPTAAATVEKQPMPLTYSWNWGGNYGYGTSNTIPTPTTPAAGSSDAGSCSSSFTGPAAECPYPPTMTVANGQLTQVKISGGFTLGQPVDANGFCPAGYGVPDSAGRKDSITKAVGNLPQAPCGFACHTTGAATDYYTMVRSAQAAGSTVQLRLDVILAAAANVVSQMETFQAAQNVPNLYSLGIYEFNNSVNEIYPTDGTEAGTDLPAGLSAIQGTQTPAVTDAPNTNFPAAMTSLMTPRSQGGFGFTNAGSGGSPSTPRKNLFIITDGLVDYGNRTMGPMAASNCNALKTAGFNIYVLYTPYTQLANDFYLTNDRGYVEPTSSSTDIAALEACASGSNNSNFFIATSSAEINTALNNMLQSALNSPAILTQ